MRLFFGGMERPVCTVRAFYRYAASRVKCPKVGYFDARLWIFYDEDLIFRV